MKRLVILFIIIGMVGIILIGCGSNNVETNNDLEEAQGIKQEQKEDSSIQEDREIIEPADDAEKVLLSYFEAMVNQDIETARKYVLFDDLDFPYSNLENTLEYYLHNRLLEITGVKELSEDIKLIDVNMGNPQNIIEDAYLLKKVNNAWYVAPKGVIARERSKYTDDQVKDGEVGIYLKNIYHKYDGTDTYVIRLVNNTSEKLNIGFVNNAAIIYEDNTGKNYLEFDNVYTLNPYSREYMFFNVDSSKGPVKSIILKETMLGLQPQTSDVEVFMGEMISE